MFLESQGSVVEMETETEDSLEACRLGSLVCAVAGIERDLLSSKLDGKDPQALRTTSIRWPSCTHAHKGVYTIPMKTIRKIH